MHFLGYIFGLATRRVQLMLLYPRSLAGVRSFSARVEPNNLASMGVARTAGFMAVRADDRNEGRVMLHLERHD